jgi:hypothetical protein
MPLPNPEQLAQPSIDALAATSDIVDEPTYDLIVTSIKKLVPEVNDNELYKFALHCGDVGASAKTQFRLDTYNTYSQVIRKHATLRQFCSLFANLAFEWFDTLRAPATWRKAGYTEATKSVAFDYASAIGNPHALGKPHRPLTDNELVAIQANRSVHIFRANAQTGGAQSTAVELTSGGTKAKTTLLLPPPPAS